jgi:molecular chaperone GrpE
MDEHNRYREEELEEEKNRPEKPEAKTDKARPEGEPSGEHCCSTEENDNCDGSKNLELIEQQQKEIARLNDLYLRNAAELENFKRRTNEERIRDRKYALESFLGELVDVVDIFDAAVNFQTEEQNLKNFLFGFKMINDRFRNILKAEGVVKIDALGKKFDPTFHHALEKADVPDKEEGIVVEVMRSGYMYKDRILRPAMVKVNHHEEPKKADAKADALETKDANENAKESK